MSNEQQQVNVLIPEDNTAGSGGALGISNSPGVDHSSDWYAPGDARLPYKVGTFKRFFNTKNKNHKKKKKKI